MKHEDANGQVWTSVQYPTHPCFQTITQYDGVCHAVPAPINWGLSITIWERRMIEALEKHKSHKYRKPMIIRCRALTWAEMWVLNFTDGIRDVNNIVRDKGFITETELKNIMEKYGK